MFKYFKMITSFKNYFLIGMVLLVVISVLLYNVVHFSNQYGIPQVNFINSLFLVPFILIVISFGVFLEQLKRREKENKIDSFNLSPKEKEVIILILEKKKNQEIADQMFVELSTIKTHINKAYKKIGVKNRKELFKSLE